MSRISVLTCSMTDVLLPAAGSSLITLSGCTLLQLVSSCHSLRWPSTLSKTTKTSGGLRTSSTGVHKQLHADNICLVLLSHTP